MTKKLESKYNSVRAMLTYSLYCLCTKVLKKHKAFSTADKGLAERFKKAGFLVTLDFDNTTFVVAEV